MTFLEIWYQHGLKKKKKSKNAFKSGEVSSKRKKMRIGQNHDLEKALFSLLKKMRANNLPVNATVVKEKAIGYAKELQIEGFKASNGWFEIWKTRFNVSFKAIAGEEKSVTPEKTFITQTNLGFLSGTSNQDNGA